LKIEKSSFRRKEYGEQNNKEPYEVKFDNNKIAILNY
jgi:hypothetical protein